MHYAVHDRRPWSILPKEIPFLPSHPSWLERIPELLQTLNSDDAPPLLRRTEVEHLFGVRRRRAIALLHRCHAKGQRGELVAAREAVVAFLEGSRDDEAAARAQAQQQAVAQTLADARRALRLPTIPLPSPEALSALTFAGLPPGIHLTRERLSIDFATGQDLVEKLFALAQAFANDYESLEAALAGTHPESEGSPHGITL